MQLKYVVSVFSFGLAIVSLASPALAHDFITDQECPEGYGNGMSFHQDEPFGVEFVPQMSSLDVVELIIGNTSGPSTVAIRIRSQTIDGPVLATSNELVLADYTPRSYQHIDFASSVPLVPGQAYKMEFVFVSGTGNPVLWGGTQCSAGRIVSGNLYDEYYDFTFREGPAAPLPVAPSTWGGIKALYR
jgi:hypothetical protein